MFDKNKIVLFQIKNFRLYSLFLLTSIVLICISFCFNNFFLKIIENIAYSIIAATFMAIIMDYNDLKRKIKFKENYFEKINRDLSTIIGRFLWFEEHLNDERIDWKWELEMFTKIEFSAFSVKFHDSYDISFSEAKLKLIEIGDKYSSDKFEKLTKEDQDKVKKLFQILAFESENLGSELNKFNSDLIILELNDYIDYNQFSQEIFKISMAIYFLNKSNVNYQAPIKFIIQFMEYVRDIGNYSENIKVSTSEVLANLSDIK